MYIVSDNKDHFPSRNHGYQVNPFQKDSISMSIAVGVRICSDEGR